MISLKRFEEVITWAFQQEYEDDKGVDTMMPVKTKDAVVWALQQEYEDDSGFSHPVTTETPHQLVHYVREYFNAHGIAYESFSFADLVGFLGEDTE